MGKPTGFLEYERKDIGDVPVAERITTFNEFHTPITPEERKEQAARCMNCGVPYCQSAMKLHGMVTGCPLHNLIPEWNDQIYQGHLRHASQRLLKTSNFPEFTGRVCPALCEKACMNGAFGDAVTIHDNEKFLIETAWENGWVRPRIPEVRSGKTVAVVGSGPSGLAVADELNHRGHSVTVFERDDRIGGLLMYGIPNMKLDKKVIERRRKLMEEEGVVFQTGVDVGKDITAEELKSKFDAVVLCCGAKNPRPLQVANPAEISGVYYAVDFLKSTTRSLLDHGHGSRSVRSFMKHGDFISAKDKNVVIVGGGDTGNDCIGTVIRHGCHSVTALEMMPKPPVVRAESNPWPEWPRVLKTDYGHEEAIEVFGHDPRIFETTIKSIEVSKKNELRAVETVKVHFDENHHLVEVPGSEKKIRCELLLIAAGFVGCEPYTAEAFKLPLSKRGTVVTQEDSYATPVEGIFTAGDMHRGQSLVVWAITEGRQCAHDVDEYLMGYTNLRKS
ncbi:MAG: glutamate synthase subunit beta [Lachnospiraceae bacterium]|nr:glutamate synthase subunit beta [Lachnospiraceae bacterium]